MNDDLLSQSLKDYDEESQAKMLAIIEEERGKTKAMIARDSAQAGAVLIGGVGAPDGVFGAVGPNQGP